MKTNYYDIRAVRVTARGATQYAYRLSEDFGRERGYARSWGAYENRGNGMIWARHGETFEQAIARRKADYCEV